MELLNKWRVFLELGAFQVQHTNGLNGILEFYYKIVCHLISKYLKMREMCAYFNSQMAVGRLE